MDNKLTCQCGKQFKTQEELQKHEQTCAVAKQNKAGQQNTGPKQDRFQGSSGNQGNVQPGRAQTGSVQGRQERPQTENQPKTRTAGGSGNTEEPE